MQMKEGRGLLSAVGGRAWGRGDSDPSVLRILLHRVNARGGIHPTEL